MFWLDVGFQSSAATFLLENPLIHLFGFVLCYAGILIIALVKRGPTAKP